MYMHTMYTYVHVNLYKVDSNRRLFAVPVDPKLTWNLLNCSSKQLLFVVRSSTAIFGEVVIPLL